jgi:lipid A 3-O-deacylase
MRVDAAASQPVGMRSQDVRSAPARPMPVRVLFTALIVWAVANLTSGISQAQQPVSEAFRVGPIALRGDAPSYLELGAGVYDLVGDAHRHMTAAGTLEFHYGRKLFGIGPMAGIIQNIRGGGMVYAGFYSDFAIGPIIITPQAGAGAWWHGGSDDENLGGTWEFRLGLNVAYEFQNKSRLGVRLGHISNKDMYRKNPGDNDVMLTYAFPLGF